jgi:GMP synthase-like glutamine amidotransferase
MPRGVVLQTQETAPPALLGTWADERQIRLDVVRVDREPRLPDPAAYAFAVALGSDASLAEPAGSGWLGYEIDWLRDAERAGIPVLGIGFGAQALAVAHAGRVTRLAVPEIGWIELETADEETIPSGPWLAWREDTITLPPFAYELARNEHGVQAFSIGRHLGVQFHPEATPELAAAWAHDPHRRLGADAATVEADRHEHATAAADAAHRLFDRFAGRAGLFFGYPTLARA